MYGPFLIAQAEADAALARLAVWLALLAAAQVRGDLTPFFGKHPTLMHPTSM